MTLWQWTTWQGQPFLTCDLLRPWPHGFFTRNFAPQVPETLTPVLHPQAQVQRVKQVHGDRVLTPGEMASAAAEEPAQRPEADGLMSDGSNQALWVCSADCNPVLVGDRATGRTAAIHAGWRGTALKIVPQAIIKMQAQGSDLKDLVVAIGPAIAGEVYQVSTTVAAEVGRTIVDAATAERFGDDQSLVQHLQALEDSPLLRDDEPGKARLDVRRVNAWQLRHLGLSADQVAIAPHCTFQEPERFFSYRRTGEKQVQWSGIVSGDGC